MKVITSRVEVNTADLIEYTKPLKRRWTGYNQRKSMIDESTSNGVKIRGQNQRPTSRLVDKA